MWIKIIFFLSVLFIQSNNESFIWCLFDKRLFFITYDLLENIVSFSSKTLYNYGNSYVYCTIVGLLFIISVFISIVKKLFRSYFKMKSFNESYEENAKKYIEFQDSINQDVYKRLLQCNKEQIALKTLLETRESIICCVCQNEKATQTLIPCGHFCLCGKCLRKIELKSKKNVDIYKCPQCREPKGLIRV